MEFWKNVSVYSTIKAIAPEELLSDFGFTRATIYSGEKQLPKILASGTFSSWGFGHGKENIPYLENAFLYKNYKEKKCCLIYLPCFKAREIEKKINIWASERNLKASVYEESWLGEKNCTVVITLPDVDISLKSTYFISRQSIITD